jgi:hypothetical protein
MFEYWFLNRKVVFFFSLLFVSPLCLGRMVLQEPRILFVSEEHLTQKPTGFGDSQKSLQRLRMPLSRGIKKEIF